MTAVSNAFDSCPPSHSQETCARPHYARSTANSSARKHALNPRSTKSPSSSSRSRPRLCNSPTIPSPYSDAAATDPEHTTQLWETVMACLSGARTGGRATPSVTRSGTSASTSVSVRIKKETTAKITDADFMESVLEPYGITIQYKDGAHRNPTKHFGVPGMPRDYKLRLQAYKERFDLSVWLEPNMEHIQREYKAMRAFGSNEAEHQTFALCNIFLDEPRYPELPEDYGDKRWLPIRLVQLVQKPPQDQWFHPPPMPGSKPPKRYEWDIRPDCAYLLSLQAFQPGFRSQVQNHVSVVQQRAFCPYLTIEFKKDEENLDTARYQVAVSSAMSIYNRYLLKSSTLQASGASWSEEDQSQMRHYGITFTGSNWNLWCTVPKSFSEWTGCTMSSIYSGDCRTLAGIGRLVEIINDVHYWGLEVYGKSCKNDIYTKTRLDPDADISDVSLLE